MLFSRKAIQRCSCAVALAWSLCCFSCGDCIERPSIASIAPTSAIVGSPSLMLVVNGDHFVPNSSVNWSDMARPTTFVTDHQLKANISAEDLATAALVNVTVFSPPQPQSVMLGTSSTSSATASVKVDCAGGTSNVFTFAINP
jgi:hypothetical protein